MCSHRRAAAVAALTTCPLGQMHEWKEEKAKLEHSIQVLERSKQQERTKGERLLRANMAELQKVKKEMERHKRQLDEKEKEIRLQVLQVKKLRRQLRELALGGGVGGGGGPRSGWNGGAGGGDGSPGANSDGGRSVPHGQLLHVPGAAVALLTHTHTHTCAAPR